MKWHSRYSVILIIILCFVSRLPQLFSENLLLDGDECIVGLMAKHFSDGTETPYFFYGQSYGFSLVEVSAIRIFYAIFDMSDISVKLAMLSIWTLGIIFFYKTLKTVESGNNKWAPLLFTLAFIVFPAWAMWSMKARGGYLTAFLFSSIIIYLISSQKWNSRLITSFFIGFSIIIIFQSQVLWLAGLIPILLFHIFQKKQIKQIIALSFGLLTGMTVFYFIKINISTYWSPEILKWPEINYETISSMPERIYQNLTGSYSYGTFRPPIFATSFLAISTTVFIFVSLVFGFIFLFKRKKINPMFYVLCCSVLFSIGYMIILIPRDSRYLLPLCGYAFFMFYLLLNHFQNKTIINLSLSLAVLVGAYSMYDFKNYKEGNKARLTTLIKEVEDRKIKYVYCEGGLLQWEMMFYSNEQLIARFLSNVDRYPEYIRRVDNAFSNPKNRIGLVGYLHLEPTLKSPDLIPIHDYFFFYENPSKKMLLERGFDLSKAEE